MSSTSTPESEPKAAPKPDEQGGFWSKVFAFTPVILTIIATTLAGISSSELTQSMSWRSVAAQNQSKAGDQWSFFQVKRIRGTTLESTVELMQSLGPVEPLTLDDVKSLNSKLKELVSGLDPKKLEAAKLTRAAEIVQRASKKLSAEFFDNLETSTHLTTIFGGKLPNIQMRPLSSDEPAKQAEVKTSADHIEEVRKQIRNRKPESKTADLVAKIKLDHLDQMIEIAEEDADAFDNTTKPISDAADQLRRTITELVQALKGIAANWAELAPGSPPIKPLIDQLNLGTRMAVLDFNARRYRLESTLNQRVAEMYEVRVRWSGAESDRHRTRSTYFFYAMIAAQAGVTVSSLAMARKRKSLLWFLATIAGLCSIAFAGWVYLSR